jgi:Ran GTPase-activating protein (RanGAP) involved in mRNA processing and transport
MSPNIPSGTRALTSINLTENNIAAGQGEEIYQQVGMNKLRVALRDGTLTALDVSDIGFGAEGAKVIARYVSDNGALTSLHVGKNKIPEKEMREIMVIAMPIESMKILCEIPFKDKTLTELDVSGKNLGTEGALVVAEFLDGNGAMTSLDVSENKLLAKGTELLAVALKGNQTLTALNISSNDMTNGGMSGVIALADDIPDMGALLSTNFLGNKIPVEQARKVVEIMQSKMKLATLCGLSKEETELDFSGRGYGPGDAVLIANDIGDMRALTIANVMGNGIGKEMLSKLQDMMRSKPNLVSLCGIADDATEVDLSGLGMDADDAIILASELPDKQALMKLTFGDKQANTMTTKMAKANFSGKLMSHEALVVAAFLPKCK